MGTVNSIDKAVEYGNLRQIKKYKVFTKYTFNIAVEN